MALFNQGKILIAFSKHCTTLSNTGYMSACTGYWHEAEADADAGCCCRDTGPQCNDGQGDTHTLSTLLTQHHTEERKGKFQVQVFVNNK